ncbi:type II toxin-antitoxin system RelE/ParE family toxin [Streptococcus thoraltensis]|uniref:type II toxin-antitoxin system RelE/ParE family toxin n=1 Tax=Streptococcus thoraltensis TaxID=55085 RepID=UPI000366539D|nr:type II toxin-antitoxin system RelE/ParE family toxin [Streptococcus thoraltensis]MDY4760474.1 type II toxin-antitoxin system RelE/ParE family toxin [Streptococcus thoraltensis]
MSRKLMITSDAEEDLDDIYQYILNHFLAPQAAENTMTNIRLAIEQLLEIPSLGIDVSDRLGRQFSKEHVLRMTLAGKYLVFYIDDGMAIVVLRVLYQKRNWIDIFK